MDQPCGEHTEAIKNLKKDTADQWAAIDKLRNRLPLWVTIVLMVMSGGIASSLTFAGMIIKFSGK